MDITIWIAHLLFAYAVFVEPVIGVRLYRSVERDAPHDPGARLRFYNRLIALEWAWMVVIAIILWNRPDPLRAIGVTWPQMQGLGAVFVWAVVLIVVGQTTALVFLREKLSDDPRTKKSLAQVIHMLPRTRREELGWTAVSITAGVCEEFLYRGFLFFYIQEILGLSLWIAIMASSAIFGLAHIYQGVKAAIPTAVIALVMAGIYAVSGSLLIPIVLHAILDLRSLLVTRFVIAEDQAPA